MTSDTYNLIRQAILDEQQIHGTYNGHRREMCPHAIGTKNGHEKAILLQFGGTSSSGLGQPEDNWRCIFIDRLTDVSIQDGSWHTASNHSQPQTCIDEIDVEYRSQYRDREMH